MELWVRILLLGAGTMLFWFVVWDSYRRRETKIPLEHTVQQEMTTGTFEADSESTQAMPTATIITLHIMAKTSEGFPINSLLATLRTVQNRYGGLQLLQRQPLSEDTLFYVASALEPGYLDQAEQDGAALPGITLFFELTDSESSAVAFELMLKVGHYLAARLNGDLLNHGRQPLTMEGIAVYRKRITDYHLTAMQQSG